VSPNDLVDPAEVAALAQRYGEPYRVKVVMEVGPAFFEPWSQKAPTRRGEVMFLMPRPAGLLLHAKSHYPEDTWRLLTGGIEVGERVAEALQREPGEETGLTPEPEVFLALIEYEFHWNERSFPWVTYVFRMAPTMAPLRASVDAEIFATREVSPTALAAVADALEALPPPRTDWGRYRAVAHRVVADLLQEGGTGSKEHREQGE